MSACKCLNVSGGTERGDPSADTGRDEVKGTGFIWKVEASDRRGVGNQEVRQNRRRVGNQEGRQNRRGIRNQEERQNRRGIRNQEERQNRRGIRNREGSPTGRGSITGKQGESRRVVRQAGVRRPEGTKKGRRVLPRGQTVGKLENTSWTDTDCAGVTTNWRRLAGDLRLKKELVMS